MSDNKHQARTIPSAIQIRATDVEISMVGIEAAAAEGEPSGPPRFNLVANTGAPMMLEGFSDPVVIDMAGAKFAAERTPVLADHDTSKRIGYTTSQSVKAGKIVAKAVAASSMEISRGFVEDAKAGFPFQVSVGASIVKGAYYEKGDKVKVNGRTYKGPIIVASESSIRELSVVVLGADPNTSATISATLSTPQDLHPQEEKNMSFEEYVQGLGFNAEDLNDDQTTKLMAQWKKSEGSEVQASAPVTQPAETEPTTYSPELNRQRIAAEESRIDSLRSIATRYSDAGEIEAEGKKWSVDGLKAHAIEAGWDADRLEVHLLRASRNRNISGAPAIHVGANVRDMDNQTLACAMVRASGRVPRSATHQETGEEYGWEHSYNQRTLEASDHKDLRNVSLHQVFDLIIQAATGTTFSGNRHSQEFIQATRSAMMKIQAAGGTGMSTFQATQIFDDVANKLLLAGYQGVNSTWQEWCGVRSVNDFKTANMYRLVDKGSYLPVGNDGQLKHGTFADQKYTISVDTYGKMVGLTRKNLIDDDLDALGGRLTALGIEAAKFLEELAYVQLLTGVGTTWAAGNNNLSSGAGSDLTIAGLSAAQQLFEDQVDEDAAPLMIEPDRILVGTQDRVQAGQLFNDTDVREGPGSTSTKKEFTRNPHTSAFRPIVSGYLNNSSILQRVNSVGSAIPNQNSNQWWMFPNPAIAQGTTIMMAFLNGNRTPFLEQSDAAFDMLGLQWRAYHDAGVGVGDPKLSVRSAGA